MPVPRVEDAVTEPPLIVISKFLPPMPVLDSENAVTEPPLIVSVES